MTFQEVLNAEKDKPSPFDIMVEEICAATCRSRQTVMNWILRKQQPNPQAKKAIAKLLDIPVEQLFPGE